MKGIKRSNADLMTIEQVMDRVCISRSNIYLMIKKGIFPSPYKLSERLARWKTVEIDEYLANLPRLNEGGV